MNDHLTCPNCNVTGYLRKRATLNVYSCYSCGTMSSTNAVINNRAPQDDGSEELKD